MPSIISAGTTAGSAIALTGDTTGNLAFQTNGTTTAMTINTSQNVGIGTTSPDGLLTLPATASNTPKIRLQSATSDVDVTITSYADSVGTYAAFASNFYLNSTGDEAVFDSAKRSSFIRVDGRSTGAITFGTADTGVTPERMRIDSSGNVLVGTTNSSLAKFAVNGNGYFDTQLGVAVVPSAAASITVTAALNSGNGGNPQNCIRCNTNQSPGSNPFISFYNLSGNLAGSITHTGTTTVAYNTSSDYRLKENIAPMTGALAKVAALKPCTYTWKEDGTDGQGFIAHELQEVCPDAVSGEKDAVNEDGSIRPQGVDTSFLVATLTAAIQEQQAMIETLQAEVAALKGVN